MWLLSQAGMSDGCSTAADAAVPQTAIVPARQRLLMRCIPDCGNATSPPSLIRPGSVSIHVINERRDGIDERLIVAVMRVGGNGERLTMRSRPERRRTYVRDPNLDRAQALVAQPFTMLPYLAPGRPCSGRLRAGGLWLRCRRHANFHTWLCLTIPDGEESAEPSSLKSDYFNSSNVICR